MWIFFCTAKEDNTSFWRDIKKKKKEKENKRKKRL